MNGQSNTLTLQSSRMRLHTEHLFTPPAPIVGVILGIAAYCSLIASKVKIDLTLGFATSGVSSFQIEWLSFKT